jgi:hypothetical protein
LSIKNYRYVRDVSKVQSIFTGSYILPSADDKRRINVSRERGEKGSYLLRSTAYLVLASGA